MPDQPTRSHWVAAQEFGNELEASIAVAILDASGIPAIVRSNDSIGLFGPAFQGFSSHGVTVMVPSAALEAARTTLALARAAAESGGAFEDGAADDPDGPGLTGDEPRQP